MEHHIDGTEFFSKREAKARFRQHILNFWGNKCAYCREPLGRSGTLDHVRPKSKGGETRRSNLVGCCYACNMSKGSCTDWLDWFRAQHFWEPHLEDAIKLWISQ
jgi:5-methylcytosine-specific restriction endonuclease McrA